MMNLRLGCLCLLLATLTACGGRPASRPTATVKGTVTYQGKAIDKGRIIFVHSSGQAVAADIGSDGSFSLAALVGRNQVAVQCLGPDYPNPSRNSLPAMLPGKNLLPSRYAEPATSGLTLEVKPGENKPEFTLKD
jgi:hypothetical protein